MSCMNKLVSNNFQSYRKYFLFSGICVLIYSSALFLRVSLKLFVICYTLKDVESWFEPALKYVSTQYTSNVAAFTCIEGQCK